MSSCSKSNNVLSYLLGELDEDERVLFEQHIDNCPLCRDELRLERILQNGLTESLTPDAAPPELSLNVLKKTLTAQQPRFPFWQIALTLLSGVTVFFVLLHIIRSSTLPDAGIGLLIRFIDKISAVLAQANSFPIIIASVIVLIGLTSFVASMLPEK